MQPAEDGRDLRDRDHGVPAAEVDPAVDANAAPVIGRSDLDQDATIGGDDRSRQRNAGGERRLLERGIGPGEIGCVGRRSEYLLERPATGRRVETPDPTHLTTGGDRGLGDDTTEGERRGRLSDVRSSRGSDRG